MSLVISLGQPGVGRLAPQTVLVRGNTATNVSIRPSPTQIRPGPSDGPPQPAVIGTGPWYQPAGSQQMNRPTPQVQQQRAAADKTQLSPLVRSEQHKPNVVILPKQPPLKIR